MNEDDNVTPSTGLGQGNADVAQSNIVASTGEPTVPVVTPDVASTSSQPVSINVVDASAGVPSTQPVSTPRPDIAPASSAVASPVISPSPSPSPIPVASSPTEADIPQVQPLNTVSTSVVSPATSDTGLGANVAGGVNNVGDTGSVGSVGSVAGLGGQSPSPLSGNVTSGPVLGTALPTGGAIATGKSGGKGKLALIAIAAFVFISAGSAAAYFGVIAPAKPENVWQNALTNTSKGYQKLVEYSANNADAPGASLDGDYEATLNTGAGVSTTVKGDLDGAFSDTDAKLDVSLGSDDAKVTASLVTKTPDNSTYPDIYLKASGLGSLNQIFSGMSPDVSGALAYFEDQWFVLNSSTIEAIASESGDVPIDTSASAEDVSALLKAIGDVNDQYLYSTDEKAAVLKVQEFVGKEDKDGRKQYHYKVNIVKDNVTQYLQDLSTAIEATEYYSKVTDSNSPLFTESQIANFTDGIDESSTVDVWVDAKTKLIRFVRFTDADNAENYLELGLKYDGKGDDFPFVIDYHVIDDGGEASLKLDAIVNFKQKTTDISATLDSSTSDSTSLSIKINAKMSVLAEAPNIEKPANAQSIEEFLDQALTSGSSLGVSTIDLGLGSLGEKISSASGSSSATGSSGSAGSSAVRQSAVVDDEALKAEADTLQESIEAFRHRTGMYPMMLSMLRDVRDIDITKFKYRQLGWKKYELSVRLSDSSEYVLTSTSED